MAQVRFYDLATDVPELYWSPHTTKTRLTLNIKNIPFETKWVNFENLPATISAITKSDKQPTVPVIEDLTHEGKAVQDSWDIAVYLEEAYPDSPSLFHGNIGLHKFFYDFCNSHIIRPIFKLVVLHIASHTGSEETNAWFRKSREEKFGVTLEEFAGEPSENISCLGKVLAPIHNVLQEYPFMTGDKVGFADVVLAAYLNLLYALKPELFEPAILNAFDDDVLRNWWKRMEQYR